MDHGYATSKYRINKARSLVKALNSVKDEKSEPVEFWGRKSDGNLPSDDDPKVQLRLRKSVKKIVLASC